MWNVNFCHIMDHGLCSVWLRSHCFCYSCQVQDLSITSKRWSLKDLWTRELVQAKNMVNNVLTSYELSARIHFGSWDVTSSSSIVCKCSLLSVIRHRIIVDTSNDAVALLSVLNMGEAKIIIMCRGWELNVLLFSSRDPGTRQEDIRTYQLCTAWIATSSKSLLLDYFRLRISGISHPVSQISHHVSQSRDRPLIMRNIVYLTQGTLNFWLLLSARLFGTTSKFGSKDGTIEGTLLFWLLKCAWFEHPQPQDLSQTDISKRLHFFFISSVWGQLSDVTMLRRLCVTCHVTMTLPLAKRTWEWTPFCPKVSKTCQSIF